MKKSQWAGVLGAIAITISASSYAATIQPPTLINFPASHVFLPPGFDNNDNVQIVVHGELPDTCYKAASPSVQVDHAARKVYVRNVAYSFKGCWCLDVLVPFTHTVDLGVLQAGGYQVVELGPNGRSVNRGTLPIAAARTSSPDDQLYAPVKTASVDRGSAQPMLRLEGTFQSDCIEIREIKTLHRVNNIVEVLPVIQKKENMECQSRSVPFSVQVALPVLRTKDNLIHIRTMNGQSINLVEEL